MGLPELGALRLAALAQDTIRLADGARHERVPLDLLTDDRSLGTPLDSVAWPATSEGAKRLSRVVRKKGFEPSRSCERQPLKLVRLPVPPLPHSEHYSRALAARPGLSS